MFSLLWLSGLLLVYGAHSYVLLTANLDDVQAMAKQIVESPVAGQIHQILRRASTMFNQQVRSRDNGDNQRRQFNLQDSHSSPKTNSSNDIRIDRRSHASPLKSDKNSSEIHSVTSQTKIPTQQDEMLPQDKTNSQNGEGPHQGKTRDPKEVHREKVNNTDELIALGKNATSYLNSIKQIIENA